MACRLMAKHSWRYSEWFRTFLQNQKKSNDPQSLECLKSELAKVSRFLEQVVEYVHRAMNRLKFIEAIEIRTCMHSHADQMPAIA